MRTPKADTVWLGATSVIFLAAVAFSLAPGGRLNSLLGASTEGPVVTGVLEVQWVQVLAGAVPLSAHGRAPDVVFVTDYSCPYCRLAEVHIQAWARRGVTVSVMFFPRRPGSSSHAMAVAALCANRQGEFSAVHEALTAIGTSSDWAALVDRLVVPDSNEFQACLESGVAVTELAAHVAILQQFDLQGTPSFITRNRLTTGILLGESESDLAVRIGLSQNVPAR